MALSPTFSSIIQATRTEHAHLVTLTFNYNHLPQGDDRFAAEEVVAALIARDIFRHMQVDPVVSRRISDPLGPHSTVGRPDGVLFFALAEEDSLRRPVTLSRVMHSVFNSPSPFATGIDVHPCSPPTLMMAM